ncbi:MAG: GIY-YIG nuclease family protein [Candidatus Yanofskybacteria bacterium]|nr:GIY-YIG nuclease family protein [Candidatus Yanofskybacteria bacterium]
MFKEEGKKIYIGKAANLKARLRSYLKTTDPRIQKMVSTANSLEFRVTESDIEALILESQLIKNLQPRFNIVMRDDKQYFYVVFTHEKFPKIFLTHQPRIFKYLNIEISDSVGPFTDGAVLKSTLKFLRKIFPYCTCKNPHNNFCLNYHIGKCLGVCCLKDNEPKALMPPSYTSPRSYYGVIYKDGIKAIKKILSGKKTSLVKNLEKEMIKLGKEEKFQEAIELRDKIEKLKRVFENAKIIRNTKYGILNTENDVRAQNTLKALARLLKLDRVPYRIEGYDVSNIQGTNATGAMVTFISGRPDKNLYRKFKIRARITKTRSALFHDRSINQIPSGDTGMLREVLERRLKHDEWSFPDLILIDGGKGQLNAARAAISKSKFLNPTEIPGLKHREPSPSKQIKNPKSQIPIIALAKGKYEIFSTTLEKPVSMSKLPQNVRNLIKSIDAEAHRFAITYYRRLHRRSLGQY